MDSSWVASCDIIADPTADADTGEMAAHLEATAGLAGAAVLEGYTRIYGPESGTFTVGESGVYDITFDFVSTGQVPWPGGPDCLTKGLVTILSLGLGATSYLDDLADIVSGEYGSSSIYTKHEYIAELYKHQDSEPELWIQKTMRCGCDPYCWSPNPAVWEDLRSPISFSAYLYAGREYSFAAGLDMVVKAHASGLEGGTAGFEVHSRG